MSQRRAPRDAATAGRATSRRAQGRRTLFAGRTDPSRRTPLTLTLNLARSAGLRRAHSSCGSADPSRPPLLALPTIAQRGDGASGRRLAQGRAGGWKRGRAGHWPRPRACGNTARLRAVRSVGCVSFDEHAAFTARAAAHHLAVVVKAAAARLDCECLNITGNFPAEAIVAAATRRRCDLVFRPRPAARSLPRCARGARRGSSSSKQRSRCRCIVRSPAGSSRRGEGVTREHTRAATSRRTAALRASGAVPCPSDRRRFAPKRCKRSDTLGEHAAGFGLRRGPGRRSRDEDGRCPETE
jgi:hypothetical protein